MFDVELHEGQDVGPAFYAVEEVLHAGGAVLVALLDEADYGAVLVRGEVDLHGGLVAAGIHRPTEDEALGA